MLKRTLLLGSALLLGACATNPAPQTDPAADIPFDRSVMPEGGEANPFNPPALQRAELENGLQILVAENHELPITGLYMVVGSGSAQDKRGKEGVSALTAGLLSHGTTSKNAIEISEAFSFIGSELGGGAGLDASFAYTVTLNKHLDTALELFSDVILNPTFPEAELDREKTRTLTGILQSQDRANMVADDLFYLKLYGETYYGRPSEGTKDSVSGLTQGDIQAFYDTHFVPNNATIIVAGDTTLADIKPKLEAAFGAWERKDIQRPVPKIGAGPDKTVVYLHDKPGAPQSQIRVGNLGITRNAENYHSMIVMNQALGGSFQSRINLNLREDKGYTYGARSVYRSSVHRGPFEIRTGVKTEVTVESLNEIFKEVADVNGERPLTADELDYFRGALIRRFPTAFESTGDLLRQLGNVVMYNLPDDYYETSVSKLEAVTLDEIHTAAATLNGDQMVVVVVGDRSVIEAPIREAGYEVVLIDGEGATLAE